jgi:hypothetical protein
MNGISPDLLIVGIFVAALLTPVLTLIHELGHAAVALTRTEGLVTVRVGRSPAVWQMRFGRLRFQLSLRPARHEPAGLATVHARLSFAGRIAFLVAGPIADGVAAAALLALAIYARSTTFQIVGVLLLTAALLSFVPSERRGFRSDGRRLLDELRGRNAPQQPRSALDSSLEETHTRWVVLLSHMKQVPDWERLARLLAAAPTALGYAPDDRGAAHQALCKVAYGGWSWRESERGHPERLRQPVLDALHEATKSGAVEPLLTVRAASAIAASDIDLSPACPGSSQAERQAFLSAPFERLPKRLVDNTPTGHRTFAWRYGIALHDIERLRGPSRASGDRSLS